MRFVFRIRPQCQEELDEKKPAYASVVPNSAQVTMTDGKAFTYDHAFDQPAGQQTIYERCVKNLVQGTFEGFNATVLAYGQVRQVDRVESCES